MKHLNKIESIIARPDFENVHDLQEWTSRPVEAFTTNLKRIIIGCLITWMGQFLKFQCLECDFNRSFHKYKMNKGVNCLKTCFLF